MTQDRKKAGKRWENKREQKRKEAWDKGKTEREEKRTKN